MSAEAFSFFEPPAATTITEARRWLAGATVGIAGLGLMGGSLGMSLRGVGRQERSCGQVIGWTRREATAAEARSLGCVDRLSPTLPALCGEADLIVLAAPVRTLLKQIAEVAEHARPGTLVIDLGSTKSAVIEVMSSLPDGLQAVGGHPMCGKDRGGPGAADATLFIGKVFVLCPTTSSSSRAHASAWVLAEAVGAKPLPLEANRHDRLVSLISHLPFIAASALVGVARQTGASDPLVWQLAASGFRDTTRVAASELDVMMDILLTNRAAILAGLVGLQEELAQLQRLVDDADETGLREYLLATQSQRRKLFIQN